MCGMIVCSYFALMLVVLFCFVLSLKYRRVYVCMAKMISFACICRSVHLYFHFRRFMNFLLFIRLFFLFSSFSFFFIYLSNASDLFSFIFFFHSLPYIFLLAYCVYLLCCIGIWALLLLLLLLLLL